MHMSRRTTIIGTAIAAVLAVAACTDRAMTSLSPLVPTSASAVVSPLGGQLVINEFLADPNAVTDANGEWFEVYNRGTASVDLKNFRIASGNDAVHTITASVIVPPGGYVVLGRIASSGTNGGATVAYAYGTAITLANSSDWLSLRDGSGASVDSVSWSSTTAGAAWGVKDPSLAHATVGGTNWQLQTTTFGLGDKGTPAAQNNGFVAPPSGAVASVVVTPDSTSVAVGGSAAFSAQGYDASGKPATSTFTWSSSNAAVATVSASGTATGVATGTALIRATATNGVFKESKLVVTTAPGGGGSTLTVRFLDVGQGDATYITNGTSKVIIDGGPDTVRFGKLLDSLGLNGQTIDLVVLSHEHYDHHSGLLELFKTSRNITVRYFEENQNAYSNAQLQRLRDSISARVSRGTLVYRDTDDPCANGSAICTFTLNGGAKIHVLRPNPAGSTPNNRSAVEKIVGPDSASFTMWLAGDAEQEEIGWFLGAAGYATTPGMKVTVLKADHHGSCNGVTNAYVDATNPAWVLAGVGATNTYGHMHTQAKNVFTAHGKPWYRTDGNGTVVVSTPGTPGGGYTVTVGKGSASMSGSPDRTSSQAQCNPVP